jgi:hypothetical protein
MLEARSLRAKHGPLPDGAWEDSMHPQTLHLDALWLIPPAFAITFMSWVLWNWFKEEHRHNDRLHKWFLEKAPRERARIEKGRENSMEAHLVTRTHPSGFVTRARL